MLVLKDILGGSLENSNNLARQKIASKESLGRTFLMNWVAIVRAWYTMENGPNDKNGKKLGKTWKICPDRKWGKMAEKMKKTLYHLFRCK